MLLEAVVDRKHVLYRLKEALRQMIDPDKLLLARLMWDNVLTDEDRQKVEKSPVAYQEQNDMLLNFVIRKNDASLVVAQFIDCLRDTDQDHVCNFILRNGGKHFFLVCCKSKMHVIVLLVLV